MAGPFPAWNWKACCADALFEPERWPRALYAPPFESVTGSGAGWEKVGARFFSGIGGVHVVEAAKSLYAAATPAPARHKARGAAETGASE